MGQRGGAWAALGLSPMAKALEHVAALASLVERPLVGKSVAEIANAYADWGWRADAAVMEALATVEKPEDVAAVRAAVVALYRPWLEAAAMAFQEAVLTGDFATSYLRRPLDLPGAGTCLLFSDGLRVDLAQHLVSRLRGRGWACRLDWALAALPSVTSTAKPAVTPVAGLLSVGQGLEAVVNSTGAQLTSDGLRRLLSDAGYQVLRGDEPGDPSSRGWTELGDMDSFGHEHGWKVSHHLFSRQGRRPYGRDRPRRRAGARGEDPGSN